MQYYNSLILDWARENRILKKGTTAGQALKTLEEVDELIEAVNKNDYPAIMDAIGDIYVTLVIQAEMNDTTIEGCVAAAYEEIKNRKGVMKDGVFVKEAV